MKREEDVYSALLEAIDAGDYPPGARLVETELAARFGVSRTPIREALGRLALQGVAASDGKRGLTVAVLDSGQLGELYDLREVLEGFAARLAARRAAPTEIRVLRQMIEEDRARIKSGQPLTQSNRRFHRQVHLAAHNRYLNQNLAQIRRSLVLLSGTTLAEPGRAGMSIDEHEAIVAAIEARDEIAAEQAARTHITNAYRARLTLEAGKE